MARNSALSVEEAWNAVALEERIELLERARGEGISAGIIFLLFLGATAYGFDNIWILGLGAGISIFVIQVFTTHSWRRTKPQLILSYLAVRSMARRYAFGYKLEPLDIILIFRGRYHERFNSKEEEAVARQRQSVDFDSTFNDETDVWVCLLRGGLILLSERPGGAKLEFVSGIGVDLSMRKALPEENDDGRALVVTGTTLARGRSIVLTSDYPGALFVFEQAVNRLIHEARQRLDKMRQATANG